MSENTLSDEERAELAAIYDAYIQRKKAREAEYNTDDSVEKAIAILKDGGCDASHHMQWAIDQALRLLMGMPRYEAWLLDLYQNDYSWDEGIAP